MQRKLILIIVLFFFLWPLNHKAFAFKGYFKKENYVQHIDSLRKEFSTQKHIPEKYELECLIALSYYPELKNVDIEFLNKRLKTTMAARPRVNALFKQKKNRTYRILINNSITDSSGLNYDDVPFNARIGIIGHELAHIVDYETKSMLHIVLNGIGYISNNTYRKNFEKDIDKITIAHGLGYQLYAFSSFLFNKADVNSEYLKFKEENYPSPENYKAMLTKHPEYSCHIIEKLYSS
ncbi:MAG: hypothetical protein K9I29_07470 [Bacteroidales bacterium]|nr:hypothetical protein [Bacteroidales bacterium]MCF8328121.1 hypothetical protein [Bacteroidales bacterium]